MNLALVGVQSYKVMLAFMPIKASLRILGKSGEKDKVIKINIFFKFYSI